MSKSPQSIAFVLGSLSLLLPTTLFAESAQPAQPVEEPVAPPPETVTTPAPEPAPAPAPETLSPAEVSPAPPRPLPEPPPELQAAPAPSEPDDDLSTTQFDSSLDVYLAPGALNVPYGGIDNVDYGASFDPGYQWGLGIGYFGRGSSDFAIGVSGFFDHAVINAEGRALGDQASEHIFRAGLELRPGVVIGERVFLHIPIRGGYTADVVQIADQLEANHGPVFGVGGGLDVAIVRGFYVGTAVGTDLHFFRAGRDFDAFLFSWRTLLGYRF